MLNVVGLRTRRSPLLFIVAPFGALVVLFFAIDPEPQLQNSFERATALSPPKFSRTNLTLNFFSRNKSSPTIAPEARSEAFWLSRSPHNADVTSADWNTPLTAGDFIFLNYSQNDQRKLEVVSVQEEQDRTTKIDTTFISKPYYVLICKDSLRNDLPLIKLTIDAQGRTVTAVETVS